MRLSIKKLVKKSQIRLRYPPSPTGPLHIGNARTLLFNYLFAKKNNGKVALRIEDTDKERSKLKWVQNIIDELKWLGILWDEGPDIGGSFGPYKQSQRLDIYKKYLEKLLKEKKSYYCFCESAELQAKRQEQMSRGLAPTYDGKCRNLSDEFVEEKLKEGKNSVIRFKTEHKKIKFNDLVRGEVKFDSSLMGDFIIAKNLQEPLYHFAVVVDDYEMQISHVIRGEDHLSNTPKQILIQEALGFNQPEYAHIPLLLNPDKSKMSKRAAAQVEPGRASTIDGGEIVAVSDYHQKGYLPEALINFMALLGWNPDTDKEIFSLKELVYGFSVEKVQKSGAVFNVAKLDSINSFYIRQKPIIILTDMCKPYFIEGWQKSPRKTLEKIVDAYKTRIKKLSDITELTDFFFREKLEYDNKLLAWHKIGESEVKKSLEHSKKVLFENKKWDKQSLEELLLSEAEKFNKEMMYPIQSRGYLLWPLRVALSGKENSASPFEIAEILGKEAVLERIQHAIDK